MGARPAPRTIAELIEQLEAGLQSRRGCVELTSPPFAEGAEWTLGLLLKEVESEQTGSSGQALLASPGIDLVLDSGSTGHFVTPAIRLSNTRPTNRSVQGAGGDVMRGIHEGDLGGLTGAIRVQGLQQSLLSVSKLTEQHNAYA